MRVRPTVSYCVAVGLVAASLGGCDSESTETPDSRPSGGPSTLSEEDRWPAVRRLEALRARLLSEAEAQERAWGASAFGVVESVSCSADRFTETTDDATRSDWPSLRFFGSTFACEVVPAVPARAHDRGFIGSSRGHGRWTVGILEGGAEPMPVRDPGELGTFLAASGVRARSESAVVDLVRRVCFRSRTRVDGHDFEVETSQGRWTLAFDREGRVKSVRKRD